MKLLKRTEPINDMNTATQEYLYMMLSRLQMDCLYYLGYGGRCDKHLWAGCVESHINEMINIYEVLQVKPTWISMSDIEGYYQDMNK